MQKLEHPYKPIAMSSLKEADAIVVLSGMIHQVGDKNYSTYEFSDPDRFFGGLDLIKENRFMGDFEAEGGIKLFQMDELEAFDIDEPWQFEVAEVLYEKYTK